MSTEILLRSAGNALVRAGTVLVQVRSAALTDEALTRLEQAVLAQRAASRGKLGAIAVIEETAELLSPTLRERQKTVIRGLLDDPRTYAALVVEGDGIKAGLFRTLARAVGRGNTRMRIVATQDEGIAWLLPAIDSSDRAAVERGLADARAAARSTAP